MRATLYKHALISFFVLIQINLFAQVVVNTSITPQNLVQNILAGSGVSVSNVIYTGNASSKGSYGCTGCNIGFNEGVIFSTGNAADASDSAGVLATGNFGAGGDAQLTTLAGMTTFDATALEFDVMPFFDKLEIKFQFASEEYDEYVGLGFNDAMAIWISGPGISGNQNIALAPYTTSPVNINTINNGQTWSGLPSGPCTNCAYYHCNNGGTDIVYDGYTYIIAASQLVTAGLVYHIKIAIADAADHDFDSSLLLGRNTLRSYPSTTLPCTGFSVDAGEDTTYCGIALPLSASVSTPGNYIYQWNTSNGLNDSTLQNPHLISDVTNQQYIVTVIDTANNCTASDTVIISTFLDQFDLVNVCNFSTPVTLDAGIGATYNWNTGAFTQTISVNTDGIYLCTVTNATGCSKTHTFDVMNNSFIVDLGTDITSCQQYTLYATVAGTGNFTYQWFISGNLVFGSNSFYQNYLPLYNQPVSVLVTDTVTGCTATDVVVVTNYSNSSYEEILYECHTSNAVNISLQPIAQNILWQYRTDPPGNLITLADTTPTISVTQPGYYYATADYGTCNSVFSDFHLIDTCFLQGTITDYYWVGGQGNWGDTLHWATTSGGTVYHSSSPNALSNVYFDNNSGLTNTDTSFIDIGFTSNDFNVNMSDTLRLRFAMPFTQFYPYGNILINSPMKIYGVNPFNDDQLQLNLNAPSGNYLIHTNSFNFYSVGINGTGEWTLQDSLLCLAFTMNAGTLNTNNQYVRTGSSDFRTSFTPKRLNLGTSTFETGIAWLGRNWIWPFTFAQLSVDADSATILMDSTSHMISFYGDSNQFYHRVYSKGSLNLMGNCNIHSVTSKAGLYVEGRTITDSLDVTFNNDFFGNGSGILIVGGDTLTINDYFETHVPNGYTPYFGNGYGQTIKSYVELQQGVACLDSLTIQNMVSIGAGTINAGTFSVDSGGNSNINFVSCFTTPTEYYWVDGSGNFDDTLHWATTSGGAIHPSTPPDYNSNIYFDNNSGITATDTISLYNTPAVRDFNVNMNDTLRFNMLTPVFNTLDFSMTGSANIHTPLRIYLLGGIKELGVKMMSGLPGNTLLFQHTPVSTLQFLGQGEWTLADSLHVYQIDFQKGTLRTNNHLLKVDQIISFVYGTPLTEQIYLGSSEVYVGESWAANSTNPELFIHADSATIIFFSSFGHYFEGAASQHYNKVVGAGVFQFNGNCNIHSIVSTGFAMSANVTADSIDVTLDPNVPSQKYLMLGNNDTLTVKDNIQINVLSGGNGLFQGNPTGHFNLLNGGACFDRLDISNITSIGAQVYAGVNSVDMGNNNGIIFGPCGIVQSYYWVGGTGSWIDPSHWATTSGGTVFHSTPPTSIDDVIFDANSFSSINDSVYGSPSRMDCKTFDASQVNTNATFFFNSDLWVNGSFFLSQYVNWHFNDQLVIYPTTDMDFNTNGIDLDYTNIEFFGNANEFVLDDIRTKGTITADSAGTLYFNNVIVDAESFESNYLITLNLRTSVFNLQSTFGIRDLNGVAIVNGDSSFINVGHLSNGTIGMFQANTGTYNYVNSDYIIGKPTANIIYGTFYDVDYINTKEAHVRERNFENMIWFVNTVSTTSYVGKLIFDPVDTALFYTKKLHVDTLFFNNPNGICLTDFYDTVFVANQITANSNAGNYITLRDTNTIAGSIISKSSSDVCLDYMKLKGQIATGGSNFSVGANSIDLGGNSGWNFSACINLSNVWPGDANYDLIVNNIDFLNIGLAYGFTGPVRSGASLNYIAQPVTDWSGFFNSGVNYKHGDCNGDGLVDINDTTAIGLNYGQTHPARYSSPELNSINPNLSLQIAQDTVGLSQTFYLNINLASAASPVDSIYGLAFTLQTEATLIDTSQTSTISYVPSILGIFGTDLFSYEKNFWNNGQIDAAVSRINQINLLSTYGTVGRLGIVTTDNIAAKQMIHVNISSGYAVTADGTVINLNSIGDSVLLDPNYVGMTEHAADNYSLLVYPNPSTGIVYLDFGNEIINEIQLAESKGSLLNTWKLNSSKASVNLRNYQNGFYMLNVKCGDRIIHRKVNLMR